MTFPFTDLVGEVRRLARERPAFVNVRPSTSLYCLYTERGPEGLVGCCIFGCALINLGVAPEELLKLEGGDIVSVLRRLGLGVPRTDRQRLWAAEVQNYQDKGVTWSNAVQHADDVYPLEVS